MIGLPPWEYTLRELLVMATAARRERWDHTAQLMAFLHNYFRGKGQQPLHHTAFHPFEETQKPNRKVIRADNIDDLKIFVEMAQDGDRTARNRL